jgi:formiminoglutamase/agmatinase
MSNHFGILGFPWDGGASLGRPGARYAPEAIRGAFNSWFKGRIQDEKVYHVDTRSVFNVSDDKIVDYGDVEIISYDEQRTLKNAEQSTLEILQKDGYPCVFGGDHSTSYPIIKALHDHAKGEVGIIHFDAHLDLVDETPMQGKYSQSSEIRRALELDRISEEHVVQIGVRGFNYPWYADYLKSTGILQFTAYDVHKGNLDDIAAQTLDRLSGCEKVYLTFDIDVLDPAFAPGTGADEPFGLYPHQCAFLLEAMYGITDAFDIVEVNPVFDLHGITTAVASRIMFECFTHKFGSVK